MNTAAFVEAVRIKRRFYCIKYSEFSEKIGMSQFTFYSRMRKPGTFTLDEVKKIMEVLSFTKEERMAIFCENS